MKTAPLHVPSELTFECLNYLAGGSQQRVRGTKRDISFLESHAEGGCVGKFSGGSKTSIFVLTSGNLFPGLGW